MDEHGGLIDNDSVTWGDQTYATQTFKIADTGIGQHLGYADDDAFRAAMAAEREEMDPEVREALDRIQRDSIRTMLFGSAA